MREILLPFLFFSIILHDEFLMHLVTSRHKEEEEQSEEHVIDDAERVVKGGQHTEWARPVKVVVDVFTSHM